MHVANPNTIALLERARKLCDPPTWYQLAKRTGINEATISRCRVHAKTLNNTNAYKLAHVLQMDPKDVMAYMEEDRAKDETTRAFWSHQLPRLVPSIAIAVATSLAVSNGGSLIAGTRALQQMSKHAALQLLHPIHYAHRLAVELALAVLLSLKTLTRCPRLRAAAATTG